MENQNTITYRINQTITMDSYPSADVSHEIMRSLGNTNLSLNTCFHCGDWSKFNPLIEKVSAIYSVAITEAMAHHCFDKDRETTKEIEDTPYLFAVVRRLRIDENPEVTSFVFNYVLLNTPMADLSWIKIIAESEGYDPADYFAVLIEKQPNKTMLDILTYKVQFIATISKLEKERISFQPIKGGQQFICNLNMVDTAEFNSNKNTTEDETNENEETMG